MLAQTTFLLAEDETFVRTVMDTILRREGVNTILCRDGREALAFMQQPDLQLDGVLLDVEMPDVHGLYVLREIRMGNTAQPRGLPAAILTASNDKGTVALSVALDCDAFLVKPVTRATLVDRLPRLIARKGRPAREVSAYREVDVGPLYLLGGGAPPGSEAVADAGRGNLLTFDRLRAGQVLASPLETTDGDMVLPAGSLVTDGLLPVLHELAAETGLRPVAVADVG